MIELRWVWHDLKNGSPPIGSIKIGNDSSQLYQKLQYRYKFPTVLNDYAPLDWEWSEWIDCPHRGIKE